MSAAAPGNSENLIQAAHVMLARNTGTPARRTPCAGADEPLTADDNGATGSRHLVVTQQKVAEEPGCISHICMRPVATYIEPGQTVGLTPQLLNLHKKACQRHEGELRPHRRVRARTGRKHEERPPPLCSKARIPQPPECPPRRWRPVARLKPANACRRSAPLQNDARQARGLSFAVAPIAAVRPRVGCIQESASPTAKFPQLPNSMSGGLL